MSKEKTTEVIYKKGPGGFIFFTTWIAALIYFVERSEGFGGFLLAILQSLVWPGYVVYNVLTMLQV